MNGELGMIRKETVVPISKYCPDISTKKSKKSNENLSKDS
jgi:hypothetical protein